jgi:hypothetical protein
LGHQAVSHHFCQSYILIFKAPKAHITGQQSMDHTCNMIQMIETMKGMCWSVNNHDDLSIAIAAVADMDRLPDFKYMMGRPTLLVPRKIPVDEDAILPYFPNLVKYDTIYHGTQHSLSRNSGSCFIAYFATLYPSITRPFSICFAIPRLYIRSVHLNHSAKKMKPACSPWKIVS